MYLTKYAFKLHIFYTGCLWPIEESDFQNIFLPEKLRLIDFWNQRECYKCF